jgi:hypothetical protein
MSHGEIYWATLHLTELCCCHLTALFPPCWAMLHPLWASSLELSYPAPCWARLYPTELCCTLLRYATPYLSYLQYSYLCAILKNAWMLDCPVSELGYPNPIPECCGTGLRCWMPKYRCRHQPRCWCPSMTITKILFPSLKFLKMLTEALLRIPFPVIGRCSLTVHKNLLVTGASSMIYRITGTLSVSNRRYRVFEVSYWNFQNS